MSSEEIVISNLRAIEGADSVTVKCNVASGGLPNEIYCIVKGVDLRSLGELSYDWAVAALLIPAMYLGRDILVEGGISSLLRHNLDNGLLKSLNIYEPLYNIIEVRSRNIIDRAKAETKRVATGFSAGIDSFATINIYLDHGSETGIKVTDICTFNTGAMGGIDEIGVAGLFKSYASRSESFARENNLNSISIDTNFSEFYEFDTSRNYDHVLLLSFQKTHTIRNCALALLMDNYIDFYLYSSAVELSDIKIGPSFDPAYMDPFLLAMLSNKNVTLLSSGAALSRFEKTVLVSDMNSAQSLLDVCANSAEVRLNSKYTNCSRCWKCKRTLVSLEATGALEKFNRVFDLEYYNKNKPSAYSYIIASAISGNDIEKEVLKQGREVGLAFSYGPISLIRIVFGILKIRGKRSSNAVKLVRDLRRKIRGAGRTHTR